MSLATLDDLEQFLGVEFDSGQAVRAQRLLDIASQLIETHIGHKVLTTSVTVTLTPHGDSIIVLPGFPVTAVTSVAVDGVTLVYTSTVHEYEWSSSGVLRRHNGTFGWNVDGVVVSFTYGFTTVPLDIVGVCVQVAARAYRNPEGLRSETIGNYSYSNAVPTSGLASGLALTDDEQTVLDGAYTALSLR